MNAKAWAPPTYVGVRLCAVVMLVALALYVMFGPWFIWVMLHYTPFLAHRWHAMLEAWSVPILDPLKAPIYTVTLILAALGWWVLAVLWGATVLIPVVRASGLFWSTLKGMSWLGLVVTA